MGRGIVAIVLMVLLSILSPRPLRAEAPKPEPDIMDMSLEQLMAVEIDSVYGASGYQQKVTNAPASITIITADEIRRYGYQTLADILRTVPGFYVTNDRNYSYLDMRGFGRPGDYNSRFLLLVDGHRTNDNIFDEALIGTEFPLDIDLIDRVEVIRGPNSSLYVASAFLAVINVITKPARKQAGVTASAEAGSYNTYKSRLTYGHQFSNGVDLLLSGTYFNSAGPSRLFFPEFNSPTTNNGIASNVDSDNSHQLFSSLTYRDFRLEGLYGSRDKQVPTGSFGSVFNDSTAHTVDARGYLDLAYDHKFGGNWGVMARLYYDHSHYNGVYPQESESDASAIVLNKDVSNGQWLGAKFAVSKRLRDNQTLILGSEYEYNFQQYQTNYNEQPYYQFFSSQPTSSLWAVYAQDEIRLRSDLTLDVGLRHDQYSTFAGTTNPRAALIYQPLENTTFKLLYGQSFRAPNAYELYYATAGQEGNPGLMPERVKTMEAVVEQYVRGGVQMSLSGYYYPIRSLISQATDPVNGNIVYQNSQQVDLRGVELSFKKQARSGWETRVSLSYQHANEGGSATPLTNSPSLLGKGAISVPLFQRKLFASATAEYVGPRATSSGMYTGAIYCPTLPCSVIHFGSGKYRPAFTTCLIRNMPILPPSATLKM